MQYATRHPDRLRQGRPKGGPGVVYTPPPARATVSARNRSVVVTSCSHALISSCNRLMRFWRSCILPRRLNWLPSSDVPREEGSGDDPVTRPRGLQDMHTLLT